MISESKQGPSLQAANNTILNEPDNEHAMVSYPRVILEFCEDKRLKGIDEFVLYY